MLTLPPRLSDLPEIPVLIACGDPLTEEHLLDCLQGTPFRAVARASTGEDALAAAASARPRLALIDLRMRGRPGPAEIACVIGSSLGAAVILVAGPGTARDAEATLEAVRRVAPGASLLHLPAFHRHVLAAFLSAAQGRRERGWRIG